MRQAAQTTQVAQATQATQVAQAAYDWRRTHAVIVAVEQYNGGDDLNLDGPVHDAIEMRKWLTGQGVPAENIQLLASPMRHNKAALEAVHPAYRPADRAHVRKLFREGLREIDGDWLWVYWAGHGVQARDGRWSLLYPETHERDIQGADADSLVNLLRTDHLKWSSMGRVTVVIDTCRQALQIGVHELADSPDRLPIEPQTDHDRQIFWMRACQAGAVAKNQQGAGLFTSVLLRQLKAASADGAAPDLDRVWQGVSDEFDRLREDEGTRQLPTVFVSNWQAEKEREFSWRRPLDPEQQRSRKKLIYEVAGVLVAEPGRAVAVAATLCDEFTTPSPRTVPPSAEELVDWALANPHGTATLLAELTGERPPARAEFHKACHALQNQWLTRAEYARLVALLGRLDEPGRYDIAEVARDKYPVDLPSLEPAALVDDLEALLLPPPRQLPQLLRVVEHFAALGGEVADELRTWSLGCAERLGLDGQLHERRAEAEEHARRRHARPDTAADQGASPSGSGGSIQIRLHPPGGSGQRRTYEVWSRVGETVRSLAKADTPASLEEIQRGLDNLLTRHARTLDTLVEFFVAPTDLELAVHRWQLDAQGPLERSLGTDYPVVVRCTELRANQRHVWERRWHKADTAGAEDLHWLPAHMNTFKQVHGDLQGKEDAPGAVVTAPARSRSEVFNACLFGGVPVLLWHGEAEPDTARAELEDALRGAERLKTLPQHLRKLRSASDADESHPGGHVALLWDDPHRPLPEKLDLSAP